MFIYNVGYGSYEESEYTQLMFYRELTPDQLHKYVSDAIIRVLTNITNNKYEDLYMYDGISCQEIHEHVIEELKTVGFQEITFTAKWSCFGWPSLTNNEYWSGQRDEVLDKLFNEIPDDLKTQINEMSKNYRNKRNKEFLESLKENVSISTNDIHDNTKIDLIVSPIGDLE
jgi:hypothetical protein